MKIKKLLVATLLFVSSYSFSQVSSATDFLDFSFKDFRTRSTYLTTQNWKYINVYKDYTTEKVEEEFVYEKEENGNYYTMYLLEGQNLTNGLKYSITKVEVSEEMYDNWVKNITKSSGIKFKKVESADDPYLDQYMYMGQDFVLTIEKISMDGYVSCTISVMI